MPRGKWSSQDPRQYKWVEYDDKTNRQIEAAFQRKEAQVRIRIGENTFTIDFARRRQVGQYGGDRHIKREEVEPSNPYEVDEYANPRLGVGEITKQFEGYKRASTSSDEDKVEGEGLMKLCEDLGGDQEKDPFPLLLFACKLQAKVPWSIEREEWIVGLRSLGLDKWGKVRDAVSYWRRELDDPIRFKWFYYFVFDWTREGPETRYLPAEDACLTWNQILRPRLRKFPLQHWTHYVETVFGKGVSRDVWRQLLDLALQVEDGGLDPELKQYDEDMGAWPTLIDDFVEWARKEGKLKRP
eukprot:TRINITY_DN12233_c0_g1_i2.p1 TRINITY_DN12233_c0_g1~~TRINITY_DN12233_c0_g1_i2.p1  ORF type:complete len:298 (+),score=73.35 TRINITY_DN12233_c0_g1_i2:93-986(+)